MRAYFSPEKTHAWSGNLALGTKALTVWNPAAFKDAQPSVIRFGPSTRMSFTGPVAKDIMKTGPSGSDDGGTHLVPNKR